MYQNHRILMYKEHSILSESELIDFLYDVMISLCKTSSFMCMAPVYECKYKRNSDKFNWNKESFKKYMGKNHSTINNQIIGYSLSFFSDLNEDNSCNITVSISCSEKKFSVFDLQLSYNICSTFYEDKQICNELKESFVNLVEMFDPFYACIKNDKNISGKLFDDISLIPTHLHWLNYLSNRKYLNLSLKSCPLLLIQEINNGRLVCFVEKPIDVLDEDRIAEQKYLWAFRTR